MTHRARRQPVVGVSEHTHRIEKVYMAVTDLEDASAEGVYTVTGPHNEKLPVVAIDDKDLDALRAYAQQEAQRSGKSVSIICFTNRTLHETFTPSATGDKTS